MLRTRAQILRDTSDVHHGTSRPLLPNSQEFVDFRFGWQTYSSEILCTRVVSSSINTHNNCRWPTADQLSSCDIDCTCRRATVNSQVNFEKAVFAKTSRTNARGEGVQDGPGATAVGCKQVLRQLTPCVPPAAEITMFDDCLVVYKCLGDLMFYVTGSDDENELILYAVLQAFFEATSTLLRCAAHTSNCLSCPFEAFSDSSAW